MPSEALPPQDTSVFDDELLWDSLMEYITAGAIVPVVGRDLLTVKDADGVERSLYTAIANDLAVRLQKDLRTSLDIPEFKGRSAVNPLGVVASQYLLKGGVWRRIYAHLSRVLDDRPPTDPPEALVKLAAIEPFRLYVTATFDSLLTDALTAARGAKPIVHSFDPEAPFPEFAKDDGQSAPVVFHLLGRASAIPNYVVTEEDAFEFAVVMLSKHMTSIVDLLGYKNLLIVGCRFPNWLVRFLLRVTRRKRLLHTTDRADFVVDPSARENAELVQFLQTFRTQTEIFTTTPLAFVNELDRRWRAHVEAGRGPLPDAMRPCSVFLSYAHEDREIAANVAQVISTNGPPVWFDRRELGAGDEWDRKIMKNIELAAVFVPLLSRATLRQGPRYYAAEWKAAIRYADRWLGAPFILPLVIDDIDPNDPLLPAEFNAIQASRRGADGSIPADFLERLRNAFKQCQLRKRV
jgi:hypothetical protein